MKLPDELRPLPHRRFEFLIFALTAVAFLALYLPFPADVARRR